MKDFKTFIELFVVELLNELTAVISAYVLFMEITGTSKYFDKVQLNNRLYSEDR